MSKAIEIAETDRALGRRYFCVTRYLTPRRHLSFYPPACRRMAVFAGSFVVLITNGALANWRYTHWGMSPDEVVKASNGRASLVPADVVARADKSYGSVRLAESITHLDNIELKVGFIFSIETRSLIEVGLYKGDCSNSEASALEKRLGTDYGPPLSSEALIMLDRITWRDKISGDRIVLVVFKDADSASCLVRFEPGASGS